MFVKAEHEKKSLREADEGLHLKIKLSEGANNGCDFDVFAVVNNNTDEERVCRLMLCARTASYNGTVGPQCGMKDLLNVTLPPRAGRGPARRGGFTAGWGQDSDSPVFSRISGVCGEAPVPGWVYPPSRAPRCRREPLPPGWALRRQLSGEEALVAAARSARPALGTAPWGVGAGSQDQRDGLQARTEPRSPRRTPWGSARTSPKTRCEPRARSHPQPSLSLLLQLGTARRRRGRCIPSGRATAASLAGRDAPGWHRAARGGFCLIPWIKQHQSVAWGWAAGTASTQSWCRGAHPSGSAASPRLTSGRLGGQRPRLAGVVRAAAPSHGCSASDASLGASSSFICRCGFLTSDEWRSHVAQAGAGRALGAGQKLRPSRRESQRAPGRCAALACIPPQPFPAPLLRQPGPSREGLWAGFSHRQGEQGPAGGQLPPRSPTLGGSSWARHDVSGHLATAWAR